jgi:hypothetical protein
MGWWTASQSDKGQALRKRGVPARQRQCSHCGSRDIWRSGQWRQWERPLRVIRLYPYRCMGCKHRSLHFSLHGR